MPLDRFSAFTDGVPAIVITLLVLELSVPAVDERVLPALAEEWHEFLGYVTSFVFVGATWVAHAGITKLMREAYSISYDRMGPVLYDHDRPKGPEDSIRDETLESHPPREYP